MGQQQGQHTATPWKAERSPDTQWLITSDKQFIANTLHGNDEANAVFIVQAVNSYATLQAKNAKLAEALEKAAVWVDCPEGCDQGTLFCKSHEQAEVWREIQDALALAKEGQGHGYRKRKLG